MFERGSTWRNPEFRSRLAEMYGSDRKPFFISPLDIFNEGKQLGLLHLLTPVQRDILEKRVSVSEKDIAEQLGVSYQRVSAAEKSGLMRLTRIIGERHVLDEAQRFGLKDVLSFTQQAVIERVYYQGKTPSEVAERLGHSVSHTHTLLREGRRKAITLISSKRLPASATQ